MKYYILIQFANLTTHSHIQFADVVKNLNNSSGFNTAKLIKIQTKFAPHPNPNHLYTS